MNNKMRELQRLIEIEKEKMNLCKHSFGPAFYTPYTEKEPYGFKTVGKGSDVWTEPEGYRDVTKERWTRACTICGFEQHTTEQEPIITGHKPKFK